MHLRRSRAIGVGALTVTAVLLLAGCSSDGGGDSADGEISGNLTMLNYPGWMGADEVSGFEAETGVTIKEISTPEGGNSAWVSVLNQNKGSYDFALAGTTVAQTLHDNGLLADIDFSKIPNLENVSQSYRDAFPYGIPVEQGKVGFMYNKTLLPDPPKSWKELFDRADELSGQILFPSYAGDVVNAGLLASGLDTNTDSLDDIATATAAVIAIKPDVKAFIDSGAPAEIVQGTASIAIAYDYDFASASAESDDVGWVAPSEGMPGYLDGWVALKDGTNLAAVEAFMNYHLDTENYADFINTTYASWLMPDVTPLLDESLQTNPALVPSEDQTVLYGSLKTPEIEQARAAAWQEIQNAG